MRIDPRHTRYRTVPWLRVDDGDARIRAREGGRAGGGVEGDGSVAMRGLRGSRGMGRRTWKLSGSSAQGPRIGRRGGR
jgi:hypothetical protein